MKEKKYREVGWEIQSSLLSTLKSFDLLDALAPRGNWELCRLVPQRDERRWGQHRTSTWGFPAAAQKALVNVAGNEILSQCIKQSNPSQAGNGPS